MNPLASGPPKLAALLERLGEWVRSAHRRVAAEHGLTLVQLEALRFFARANRYSDSPGGLTEFLGLTPGTVSRTISGLVGRALVEKRADPADRRRVHCVLTPAAAAIVAAVDAAERELESRVGDDEANHRLAAELEAVLKRVQQSGPLFGICRDCRHHQLSPAGRRCGLTGESLTEDDASLICREFS